jgi:fucose 4-O-acetylase-like acetyltransferase
MTGGSIMPPHQRDDSLDILKGIGCLTMVIAHQPYVFQKPDIALGLINHIAGI